jgi:hypothetical protein
VTHTTHIPTRAVYIAVIQHCVYGPFGDYSVDARFVNPDGQHLDTREIPSQTIMPVMIPLFTVILAAWAIVLFIKRHHFLRIHTAIMAIVSVYVVYLILSEIALTRNARTDDEQGWWITLIVANAIYDFLFFSTLVIASTGWCLLHAELRHRNVLLALGAVALFVAMAFVQTYAGAAFWQVLVLIAEIGGVAGVLWCIWENRRKAQRTIKAHLLVISRQGIDARTTPIFEKFRLYGVLLGVLYGAIIAFFFVNIILSLASASSWVSRLAHILVQLVVIVAIMLVYRPRGASVDRYMQADQDEDGQNRTEIALEDLDDFGIDDTREGMRPWRDGMALPLEPVVLPARGERRLIDGDGPPISYTAVT